MRDLHIPYVMHERLMQNLQDLLFHVYICTFL